MKHDNVKICPSGTFVSYDEGPNPYHFSELFREFNEIGHAGDIWWANQITKQNDFVYVCTKSELDKSIIQMNGFNYGITPGPFGSLNVFLSQKKTSSRAIDREVYLQSRTDVQDTTFMNTRLVHTN